MADNSWRLPEVPGNSNVLRYQTAPGDMCRSKGLCARSIAEVRAPITISTASSGSINSQELSSITQQTQDQEPQGTSLQRQTKLEIELEKLEKENFELQHQNDMLLDRAMQLSNQVRALENSLNNTAFHLQLAGNWAEKFLDVQDFQGVH